MSYSPRTCNASFGVCPCVSRDELTSGSTTCLCGVASKCWESASRIAPTLSGRSRASSNTLRTPRASRSESSSVILDMGRSGWEIGSRKGRRPSAFHPRATSWTECEYIIRASLLDSKQMFRHVLVSCQQLVITIINTAEGSSSQDTELHAHVAELDRFWSTRPLRSFATQTLG